MRSLKGTAIVLLTALAAALPLALRAQPVEVDVELALMVDVSRSMDASELEIQRRGYAEAIASDEVVGAILNSFTGAIAVTYVEWAGDPFQRVVVPWTRIGSREDAEAFAEAITRMPDFSMRRTSISGAIRFAKTEIESNDYIGLRRVIDISGDGPNNDGRPVLHARDAALADGIVINGLPILVDEVAGPWGIADLDQYYLNCVIGGPGAFTITVTDWKDFPLAVRRKLVLEISDAGATLWLAQATARQPDGSYDCMIGEKLRQQRELIWGEP